MHKSLGSFEKEIQTSILDALYKRYKSEIRTEYLLFSSLKDQIEAILTKETDPDLIASTIHTALAYEQYRENGQAMNEFLSEAYADLEKCIEKLPEQAIDEQKEERFKSQSTDTLWIKFSKFIKRIGFGITDIPRRLGNIFRKHPRPKKYWLHQVPLRAIAREQFLCAFVSDARELRSSYFKVLTQAYEELMTKSVSQARDLPDEELINKELAKVRTNLKKEIHQQLKKHLIAFKDNVDKVGTFELGKRYYAPGKVEARIAAVNDQWVNTDKEWKNTFLLLFEEWRSDLEVSRLIQQSSDSLKVYEDSVEGYYKTSVGPQLDEILFYIKDTETALKNTPGELSAVLKKSNYRAQKLLDEDVIPKLLETLGGKNTINSISRLENELQQGLKSIASEFKLSKTATDYQHPTPENDIASISFHELIAFEIVPALQREINQVRGIFLSELNKQITLAGDLDHMITFALSASIEQLQEQGDSESALKVAEESLQRTKERVHEIKESLTLLFTTHEVLNNALEAYQKKLSELMVNENVRDIRLRIAKAKAIQQTRAYRTELVEVVKEVLLVSKDRVVKVLRRFSTFFNHLRQRFILTSKKKEASREISDFLTTSQEKINSLPIIYKNLYKIEPTRDMELFVGRRTESDQLHHAYGKWLSGKAGSAIIYGEKWSGLTSLLNYVQSTSPFKHPIVRINCQAGLDPQENFDQLIRKLLPNVNIETPGNIAEQLNESAQKIVVVEDIQNLFLRKSSGFNEIKSLMELISRTSQRVFWIASCTLYSWNFLRKTIGIQEVFSYPISLQKPSEEELSSIVQKRNRVSGYRIIFEVDDTIAKSKSFQKGSPEEQQDQLKERFFKNLISYSEGNISMTLMYWLLSTKSVDQNEIRISSFRSPDLSFIETLGMEKILALHALILHDGLTLDQFSQTIRYGYQASFLILSMMQEDGILIKKENQYLVNPLIYRSVISLLKSKNLIYA